MNSRIRNAVLEREGNACALCGTPGPPLEVIHIVPRAMGGDDSVENLLAVCPRCNYSLDGRVRYRDFEETLAELMANDPSFRNVQRPAMIRLPVSMREVDIAAEEQIEGAWVSIAVECKISASLTGPRRDDLLQKLVSLKAEGRSVVLALATDLPPAQITRFINAGIRVWTLSDIAQRFGSRIPAERRSFTFALIRARLWRHGRTAPESALLEELRRCSPGQPGWGTYQGIVGRVLQHVWCPPLQAPLTEVKDATGANRRDFIFPNYAAEGLWSFLRTKYNADFIVVDAKNSAKGVGKKDVLQVAHYLKGHGAGLFGAICCRKLPADAALYTAREVWLTQEKMVIFLDDSDLESMLTARAAGREPENVVRQKIEDFRLSL